MTCRIDLPPGELRDFCPNFNYLVTLLEALAPDQIAGRVTFSTSRSGLQMEFKGEAAWAGLSFDSEIIPRWMFAEVSFRELLSQRVQKFLDVLEYMQPSAATEAEQMEWSEAWTAG